MEKRGDFKLSFGMIFSIFLMVIFIAFAVYAITKFIDTQHTIQIEKFKDDLQNDVDAMWLSSNSREVKYFLPDKITAVCFTDDEYELENMYFVSEEIIGGEFIEHLDLTSLVEDPYCIENINGEINFVISKDYGETLVRIE